MRWLGMGAVVAGLCAGTAARADTFDATLDQPMREARHEVALRVNDGVARYQVTRTFRNEGSRHDEANVGISLPVGAAATGLRIRAGDHWFEGELMRRERAEELYRELTGIGPHAPKDPAILFWEWASNVRLRVFPIVPKGEGTVGYSLTAPTQYRHGRYFVSYPRAAGEMVAPLLSVRGDAQIDGAPIAEGKAVSLALSDERLAWFGAHEPSAAASYVSSVIRVDDGGKVDAVDVTVDVRHTYRGDVEVELVAPDGSWHTVVARAGGQDNDVRQVVSLKFPAAFSAKGEWRLVVSDHQHLDTGTIEGFGIALAPDGRALSQRAKDTPVFIVDAPTGGDNGHATISIAAPPIDTVAARVGRVPVAEDRDLFRLEVDVAPQLRPLPKDLSLVFVVDASHSMDAAGIDRQLDLARAFLSHVPDAHFEVVLYRRFASRMLDRFAAAPDMDALRKRADDEGKLMLGNGSNLDEGIALATRALRGRKGTRMMVLMSDTLLRPSWNNAGSLESLKQAGATVHVVVPSDDGGSPRDQRDDDHALSPIANKSGGVLLHIDGVAGPSKELDALALGLVRPVRIDHFRVVGVNLDDTIPERLEEGDGLREMVWREHAPSEVVLEGKLWARPWRRVVKASLPFSKATAGFAFSHDMHHDLNEEQQFRLAMLGGAVSPVTSYLAIEPGVRPSTAGFEAGGLGLSGIGEGGGGRGQGIGLARVSRPDIEAMLKDGAAACVALHKPAPGWSVALAIDTTLDEVVDVTTTSQGDVARCMVEAAWSLRLPGGFDDARDRFDVSFR